MRGRRIPENYIEEMVCLRPEFHDFNTFRYAYFREYAIIPFIDLEDGKPYYFHSRRFKAGHSRMAPYLACPYRPEEPEIQFFMNELRVHNDEPIVIVEGTLDAMHISNSIAVNGIHKITPERIKRFEYRFGTDIIYALDNEMVDRDAKIKAKELLRMGKQVFLWREMAKDLPAITHIKDFNKLCSVAGRCEFPTKSILKYTRSNVSALL
jgi:DNA primase